MKERGPDDAPPPPADPIDNEAVQTYFLDPQTGRWNGTILGLKARQMTVALGDKYRNPRMVGLAIIEKKAPRAGGIPTPDQKKKSAVPMMAGLAAVVVVIAAGAFAAQAVMKPRDAAATDPAATAAATTTPAPGATAAQTDEASPAPTEAPTQAPGQTPTRTAPPRTPVPTAPPQTVVYSSRLANGTTVSFSGPGAVTQGTAYDGTLTVKLAGGASGTEPLTLYFGQLGTAQTLTLTPDRNGNFFFSLKIQVPKGTQPVSFSLGKNGEIRTLGTVIVR